MTNDLLKQLQKKEAELEDLRRRVQAEQRKRLVSLHDELGFRSTEELVSALRAASGGGAARVPRRSPTAVARAAAAGPRDSKHARLSVDMRKQIKAALTAGQKGAVVAREFGISYPTLHKIKTEMGMVTPRPGRGKRR
jgi:hypothetical protein